MKKKAGLLQSIDWFTIFIYLVLLVMGWMSICGATYDFDQAGSFLDFSTRSGMQIVWIASSLLLGSVILSTDDRLFESLSYLIYFGFIVVLAVTPYIAHEIKGSLSWIKIGIFSVQPAEFAKFSTALCIAKVIEIYGFHRLTHWRDYIICLLVLLPMGLIVKQRETGSALVYLSFFLMLYREGLPGCLLFAGVSAVVYFVVGVRFAEFPLWELAPISMGRFLVFLMIQIFTFGILWSYIEKKKVAWKVFLYSIGLTILALTISRYVIPFDVTWVQLAICVFTIFYLLYLAIHERLLTYLYIALFSFGSLAIHFSADYVMNNVLQTHQRERIQVLLGLTDDPKNKGYNVNQAKIAIGSGGLKGKGFLKGTQTKLKYVPEQETDFIFCTVGEEEGFIGCSIVLSLFLLLILRLIHLAERQPYAFGRVYGYCVMSIFLFHVFINVGMVMGLTPVIGIPLPFFSYGGSSLWGFTILLFIFLRIDAGRGKAQS